MILTNEQIKQEFLNYQKQNHYGIKSGINGFDDIIRMDRKNLCVITAKPNQGKSTFLNFYSYKMAIKNNWKTLYFNFETSNGRFINDLVNLYGDIDNVLKYCILVDTNTIKSLKDIYDTIQNANKNYNVDMVVIDPFMRLNAYLSDVNTYTIGGTLTDFQQMAINEDLLMVIVAHPSKLKADEEVNANSIMGSTYFYTTADFILTLQIVDNKKMITEFKTLKIRNNFDMGICGANCLLQFDPFTKKYNQVNEDYINDVPFGKEIAKEIAKEILSKETNKESNEDKLNKVDLKPQSEKEKEIPTEDNKTQQRAIKEGLRANNLNEVKVSLYHNCNFKIAFAIVPIKEAVKMGESQKDIINEIRKICNEKKDGWESKKRELKTKLQCFTPSKNGYFRDLRGNEEYNNIISFDIDEKDNTDLSIEEIKNILLKDKYTLYCGLSASGRGLYGFYIGNGNVEDFKEQFNAVIEHLKEIGINADTNCSDVTRLRFASFDNSDYWNVNAEPFLNKIETHTPSHKYYNSNCELKERKQLDEKERKWFNDAINEINNTHLSITHNHEESRAIGLEIAYYFGESGLKYYLLIRKQRVGYNEQISTQKYHNICRWVANNDYIREGRLQTLKHFYNKAIEKRNNDLSYISITNYLN